MFIIAFLLLIAAAVLLVGLKLGDKPSYVKGVENQLFLLNDGDFVDFDFEGKRINLEVAMTVEKKAEGLMGREELGANSGMLFIYSEPRRLQFWMKNTLIPLDIIYLDSSLEVIKIHQNTKPDQITERYASTEPAQYVIEMNGGWSEKNNLKVGDKFTISDNL